MREYAALPLSPMAASCRLAQREPPGRVTLDDPAFSVMTDLREVPAVATSPRERMDLAHRTMLERGVRLLFVLGDDGTLAGVVTTTDILGEKPLRHAQAHGVSHAEILVADVMTPATALEAITLEQAAQMRVGHIAKTLKAVGRQHLMVSEDDGRRVRGLFSASQIARQLGIPLETFTVAHTFAEVEAALSHH